MTATRTVPATERRPTGGHGTRGAAASAAPRFDPQPRPRREDVAAPQAPRHLRLVDPAEVRRRRVTRLCAAVLVAAVCAGLFSIVVLRVLLAQGQAQVDRLQASVDSETATEQRLGLQVAELESPAQIVAAARARLGMVTPTSVVSLNPPPAAAP